MPHYPNRLRNSFCEWVEVDMPEVAAVEQRDASDDCWPARKLLGAMVHCSDILPGDVCDDLDIPRGSSYAIAAQMLLRERKRVDAV
jgi:hypothetical protein